MKKTLLILLFVAPTLLFSQKSAGTLSREDDLSKTAIAMGDDYANNNHTLWNEKLSDKAIVRVNNTVMDGKTVKEVFKSHHTIFNNIKVSIESCYFINFSKW